MSFVIRSPMRLGAESTTESPESPLLPSRLAICLACGGGMAPCLVIAASPRCHDCRDIHAPLRADLVEPPILRLLPTLEPESEELEAA